MYDFTVRNLKYVVQNLDADGDGWPEGLGNVERTGMGPEKLDNTVYFIRGLYDLADMAQSKHDTGTYNWASGLAASLRDAFDTTWWYQAASQYADSLGADNAQSFQKHWIGQTPMEAELQVNGQTVPGLAPYDHGNAALAGRENDCYSGTPPLNPGLFHTACGGGPEGLGERVIFGLTTSIQSIGEGNYGRLGADQQGRYTDALAQTMLGEPATGGTPGRAAWRDAGDLPVAGPGRQHRPVLDLSLDVHAGVGQLRHRVGRRAPVARRPARPRLVPRGRRPAGAGGTEPACRARTSSSARARPTCWRRTTGTATRRSSTSAGRSARTS